MGVVTKTLHARIGNLTVVRGDGCCDLQRTCDFEGKLASASSCLELGAHRLNAHCACTSARQTERAHPTR